MIATFILKKKLNLHFLFSYSSISCLSKGHNFYYCYNVSVMQRFPTFVFHFYTLISNFYVFISNNNTSIIHLKWKFLSYYRNLLYYLIFNENERGQWILGLPHAMFPKAIIQIMNTDLFNWISYLFFFFSFYCIFIHITFSFLHVYNFIVILSQNLFVTRLFLI